MLNIFTIKAHLCRILTDQIVCHSVLTIITIYVGNDHHVCSQLIYALNDVTPRLYIDQAQIIPVTVFFLCFFCNIMNMSSIRICTPKTRFRALALSSFLLQVAYARSLRLLLSFVEKKNKSPHLQQQTEKKNMRSNKDS